MRPWPRSTCRVAAPQNGFTKKHPFFYRSAPAAPPAFFLLFLHPWCFQHRFGQKKKLVVNSMFAIRFLFFLRPTQSENGVAQILLLCSVVFEQHAVIVDCCCLVVI